MAPSESNPRASWTIEADLILITFLVEVQAKGASGEKNFKKQAYNGAAEQLRLKGFQVNADQVKSRWNRLKDDYKQVKHLRGLSGFGWDSLRLLVVAQDSVWEPIVEGKKALGVWKTKPFPLYDTISQLVGDTIATGEYALSSEHSINGSRSVHPQAQAHLETPSPSQHVSTPSSAMIDPQIKKITEQQLQDARRHPLVSSSALADDNTPSPLTSPLGPGKNRKRPRSPSLSPVKQACHVCDLSLSSPLARPDPVPKRGRMSSAAALTGMSDALRDVGSALRDAVSGNPQAVAVGPSLMSMTDTPVKRKEAQSTVFHEEGLSPTSMALVPRVFRGSGDKAREYLSFDASDHLQARARSLWLAHEIEEINNSA